MTPDGSTLPALGERIARARRLLAGVEKNYSPAAFGSGFGAEDMVVLDLIARDGLSIDIFTLDTGRLPRETLELVARVRKDYGLAIKVYAPWPESVDAFVGQHGLDGIYHGVEQRKACCAVRKGEPLRRALERKRAWVTGLRREQAEAHDGVTETAEDAALGLWKFSPLADWSGEDVWNYLRSNKVPWNALHDRGYPWIGCAPCTRAGRPGESLRVVRWWWEHG